MNRNTSCIVKTKSLTQKNDKFLSLNETEQQEVLENFILSLPFGIYMFHTVGRVVPNLPSLIGERLGTYAMLYVTENKKLLCDLAIKFPKKIQVSFTRGLDIIYIQQTEENLK